MNGSVRGSGTASPNGPSRPQRSELRTRQLSEYSNDDRASSSSRAGRDSVSTTRSDASLGNAYRTRNGSSSTARSNTNSRPNGQMETKSPISPGAMGAIAAFQKAGQRQRAMTNGSDDYEYEEQRRKEREREQRTQQRIKEKAMGRRTNGKARAGDIDGAFTFCLPCVFDQEPQRSKLKSMFIL